MAVKLSATRDKIAQLLRLGIQRHTFRAPAKLEPPTPRTSVLGLDRLAKEKRVAATLEAARKKPRIDMPDDGDVNQSVFKGMYIDLLAVQAC